MNILKVNNPIKVQLLCITILCALFPVIYFKLFSAGFINWDDGEILLNNKDVHQFNLKAFFKNHYVGNYAPLTMISFAIDWLLFHGNAAGHHFINIFLHFINGVLVFYLTVQLFKNNSIAFICALIFCFHPLQMETVAWVAAKNNILCSFFFLSGLLLYIKYHNTKMKKHFLFSFLLFVLSCLSKPSAICFPLCLLLIDYYLTSEFSFRSLLNKIPFFSVAIIIGIVTLYTRTEDNFITTNHNYPFYERVGYAGYAIIQYIYSFFVPVNLSVIYPYPQNKLISIISGYIIIICLSFACYKFYKQKNKNVVFGILFFLVNLLLVLQFIPFGEVLTADRYMYLPIIGICWSLFSIKKITDKQLKILALVAGIYFGSLSFLRANVWQNNISLFNDILKTYPDSHVALNSLGAEYMLMNEDSLSYKYLDKAITSDPNYYKTYYNRGLLFTKNNKFEDAVKDFTKAIELNNYTKAYSGRASAYYMLNDINNAVNDANYALRSDPYNLKAHFVLGNCYNNLNNLDNALAEYSKCIEIDNTQAEFYFKRAIILGKKQNFTGCINDINTCLNLSPGYYEAYYWRGVAKVNLKQNPCSDFKTAAQKNYQPAINAYTKFCR